MQKRDKKICFYLLHFLQKHKNISNIRICYGKVDLLKTVKFSLQSQAMAAECASDYGDDDVSFLLIP